VYRPPGRSSGTEVTSQVDTGTLEEALARWLAAYSRLVIAGVGNSLRRDDGLGVEVVARLAGKVPQNTLVVDCDTVPESYLGPIRRFRPSHILIIDAADIESHPGSIKLVLPEQIVGLTLSTHNLPMSVLSDYMREQTRAKIAFLVIQPKNTEFGEGLSPEVEDAVKRVTELVRVLLAKDQSAD